MHCKITYLYSLLGDMRSGPRHLPTSNFQTILAFAGPEWVEPTSFRHIPMGCHKLVCQNGMPKRLRIKLNIRKNFKVKTLEFSTPTVG